MVPAARPRGGRRPDQAGEIGLHRGPSHQPHLRPTDVAGQIAIQARRLDDQRAVGRNAGLEIQVDQGKEDVGPLGRSSRRVPDAAAVTLPIGGARTFRLPMPKGVEGGRIPSFRRSPPPTSRGRPRRLPPPAVAGVGDHRVFEDAMRQLDGLGPPAVQVDDRRAAQSRDVLDVCSIPACSD